MGCNGQSVSWQVFIFMCGFKCHVKVLPILWSWWEPYAVPRHLIKIWRMNSHLDQTCLLNVMFIVIRLLMLWKSSFLILTSLTIWSQVLPKALTITEEKLDVGWLFVLATPESLTVTPASKHDCLSVSLKRAFKMTYYLFGSFLIYMLITQECLKLQASLSPVINEIVWEEAK